MKSVFGVLGAGHLAGFICQGLKQSAWQGRVLISPHKPNAALSFASRFGADIAESNQYLVDACDVVLVSVRPDQYGVALENLDWPDTTILLSAMAGVAISEIQTVVGKKQIVRAMPISSASIGKSPTPIFPAQPLVQSLLSWIGSTIEMRSEEEFEIATVNAAVYGWHFALIKELVDANIAAGLPEKEAKEIVIDTLSAAAAVAKSSGQSLEQRLVSLATPGGITAVGLLELQKKSAVTGWTDAFNKVLKRLQK